MQPAYNTLFPSMQHWSELVLQFKCEQDVPLCTGPKTSLSSSTSSRNRETELFSCNLQQSVLLFSAAPAPPLPEHTFQSAAWFHLSQLHAAARITTKCDFPSSRHQLKHASFNFPCMFCIIILYTNGLIACILLQGQDSNDGLLEASSVPTPRRQSVSSHGSPIPPNSPILEVETPAEYKICNYRSGVSSSAVNSFGISSSAVNSFGINSSVNSFGMSAPPPPPPPPFGSFPSAPQQTPSSLHMPCGLGYPGPPAAMCPTSMYTAQEAMCNGTPPLGLSMWK